MLTIVATGRDDDYGASPEGIGFIDYFALALENNLEILSRLDIEFEYIIVEWNPFRKYLSENTKSKHLFKKYHQLKDIIIDKSVVIAENLDTNVYFEYFAKNAGIRRAKHDNILILNSDICLTPEIAKETVDRIKEGIEPNEFWRARRRQQVRPVIGGDKQVRLDERVFDLRDLHNPRWKDSCICGAYSGDYLLATQHCLFELGKGYNETSENHRTTYQTGMDGEILWNIYKRGGKLKFIESPYTHIYHGKDRSYDKYENDCFYENRSDWGFIGYHEKIVSENTIVIQDS